MIWSAAIFGHHKPRFYLRDKMSGIAVSSHIETPDDWDKDLFYLYPVIGWERRAEPGDIIAIRPASEHDRWTETERKEFLIILIDDFESPQLAGLVEPYWDVDSFPIQHLKKRRFHIPLSDLEGMGVDLPRMLDKGERYSPSIAPIQKIHFFDKVKKRKASKTDNFNLINLVKGRMENNALL